MNEDQVREYMKISEPTVTEAADAKSGRALKPELLNIYQRMREVMRDVKLVAKDRYQKFDKFHYTGHDDVTDPLHDAFVKHGIVQQVEIIGHERREDKSFAVRVFVHWINVDNPGDRFTVESIGEAMATRDRGNKGDDLQFGKAISYAVKVAQLKNFMLVGGDIADNEDEQPRHGRDEREERDPQSPAVEAVGDEQIEIFVQQYKACKTRKDLDDVRDAIMPLLNKRRFTQAQEDKLAAADSSAAVEVEP